MFHFNDGQIGLQNSYFISNQASYYLISFTKSDTTTKTSTVTGCEFNNNQLSKGNKLIKISNYNYKFQDCQFTGSTYGLFLLDGTGSAEISGCYLQPITN